MLPTPSTSHVAFERVYEPAEDSYLLLDTLSSETEKAFLQVRFNGTPTNSPAPFVVEIGTGSGVVLSFVDAHTETSLGDQMFSLQESTSIATPVWPPGGP